MLHQISFSFNHIYEILDTQARRKIICEVSMIDDISGKVHQGQSFKDYSTIQVLLLTCLGYVFDNFSHHSPDTPGEGIYSVLISNNFLFWQELKLGC